MILNKKIRKKLIEKGIETRFGHYGSAMSCIDIVTYLYKNILKENDIFIMAKGHGALVIPVVLECLGKKIEWDSTNSYIQTFNAATFGTLALGWTGITTLNIRCAAGCGQVTFDNIQFSPSAVPVPAAVWLFGTALIGLVGFSKRKSRIAA